MRRCRLVVHWCRLRKLAFQHHPLRAAFCRSSGLSVFHFVLCILAATACAEGTAQAVTESICRGESMGAQKPEEESVRKLRERAEALIRTKGEDIPDMSRVEARQLVHDLHTKQIELEMQNELLRQAQAEVLEARERLANLYDLAPIGYITLSEKGLILEANLTAADLLGVEKVRLDKQPFSAFVVDEDQDAYCLYLRSVLAGKTELACELRLRPKAGDPFWAALVSAPVDLEEGGGQRQLRVTLTDDSEKHQAQERARIAAEEWESTFDAMNDSVTILGRGGLIRRCNTATAELLDRPVTEIVGHRCWELVHGTEKPIENCPYVRMSKTQRRESEEIQQNGKWFRITVDPIVDTEGKSTSAVHTMVDITERKQARLELENALTLLKASVEGTKTMIILGIDAEYRYLFFNSVHQQGMHDAYGTDIATGMSILEAVTDDNDRRKAKVDFDKALAGERFSTVHKYGENSRAYYETACGPIVNEKGDIIGATAFSSDITERKRADEEHRKREAILARAEKAAHLGSWEWDLVTGERRWSDELYRILGFEAGGTVPSDEAVQERVHPDDRQDIREIIAKTMAGKAVAKVFEHRILRPDGVQRIVHGSAWLRKDQHGKPVAAWGTLQDITERKQLDEQFETLFRLSWDFVCIADIHTATFTKVNPAFTRVLGYSEEEFLAHPFLHFIHPDDVEATAEILERDLKEGKEVTQFQNRYRCKNGAYRWLDWCSCPDLATGLVYGIAKDITERMRGEEALRESVEKYARLVDNLLGTFLYRHDLEGVFEYVSSSVTSVLGYEPEEFLAHFSDITTSHPKNKKALEHTALSIRGIQQPPYEVEVRAKDGGLHWIVASETPVRDAEGRVVAVEGVVHDITERKRAEEAQRQFEAKMQQAQKLESLGVMAGGIAHDFNNILYAILGNVDLALNNMPLEGAGRKFMQEIQTATKRASELTNQMLAYSGKGALAVERLDLSALVGEMAHLLRVSHSKKAVLKYEFEAALPAVEGDASQLRQIVMNLITNASEAVGDAGGLITLKTGVASVTREYLAATYVHDELPGGRYAFLEVSDTGCGMNAETQGRVFEPFFTTKFTGRGLGMAAVLGIARAHKGAIDIQSEVGCGTTIRVLFPALDEAVLAPVMEAAPVEDWKAHGTILVVDDEPQIRKMLTWDLERRGFTVLTAEDGREAAGVFEEHKDEIVCVLLDLTMPHMGGEETCVELHRIREDVPVILISGYREEELKASVKDLGFAGFLKKPAGSEVLLDKLRAVLEA